MDGNPTSSDSPASWLGGPRMSERTQLRAETKEEREAAQRGRSVTNVARTRDPKTARNWKPDNPSPTRTAAIGKDQRWGKAEEGERQRRRRGKRAHFLRDGRPTRGERGVGTKVPPHGASRTRLPEETLTRHGRGSNRRQRRNNPSPSGGRTGGGREGSTARRVTDAAPRAEINARGHAEHAVQGSTPDEENRELNNDRGHADVRDAGVEPRMKQSRAYVNDRGRAERSGAGASPV